MAWKQIVPFELSKMGTTPNMCLRNVRLSFGIPPKYVDAKAAMLANRNAGTLHDISTLPMNVSVPVFIDSPSVNEHVEVSDKGTFYSDGKELKNPMNQKFFGWGETLNDVRIVEFVEEPKPEPTPEPTPEPKKVWYTYKQGDTFGQVLKDLGLDEGHLWGDDGTVKYYTDQLWAIEPEIFDANGNIKIGVPFYLIPR